MSWLLVAAIVVGWSLCSIIGAGLVYQHFRKEFAILYRTPEQVQNLWWYWMIMSFIAGPFGIVSSAVVFGFKHGWSLRRPNKTWHALNRAVLGDDE